MAVQSLRIVIVDTNTTMCGYTESLHTCEEMDLAPSVEGDYEVR